MNESMEKKLDVLREEVHSIKCLLCKIEGMLLTRGQRESSVLIKILENINEKD